MLRHARSLIASFDWDLLLAKSPQFQNASENSPWRVADGQRLRAVVRARVLRFCGIVEGLLYHKDLALAEECLSILALGPKGSLRIQYRGPLRKLQAGLWALAVTFGSHSPVCREALGRLALTLVSGGYENVPESSRNWRKGETSRWLRPEMPWHMTNDWACRVGQASRLARYLGNESQVRILPMTVRDLWPTPSPGRRGVGRRQICTFYQGKVQSTYARVEDLSAGEAAFVAPEDIHRVPVPTPPRVEWFTAGGYKVRAYRFEFLPQGPQDSAMGIEVLQTTFFVARDPLRRGWFFLVDTKALRERLKIILQAFRNVWNKLKEQPEEKQRLIGLFGKPMIDTLLSPLAERSTNDNYYLPGEHLLSAFMRGVMPHARQVGMTSEGLAPLPRCFNNSLEEAQWLYRDADFLSRKFSL